MSHFKIVDATKAWQKETSLPSIPTLSQNIDKILGTDGIQLGAITEIFGLPGSGKTQMGLQLCSTVQIPEKLGGLDADALFIDTNSHFTIERFKDILNATLRKCNSIIGNEFDLDETKALNRLHYINAFGLQRFLSTMHVLPKLLATHKNIRLIVIDSIAFPFKEGIDVRKRTGVLFRIMADLQRIAHQKHLAVVVINEMSTRLGLSSGPLVSALGDSWSHRCNVRLLLSNPKRDDGTRLALIVKSNLAPNAVAEFQITSEGIRDVK